MTLDIFDLRSFATIANLRNRNVNATDNDLQAVLVSQRIIKGPRCKCGNVVTIADRFNICRECRNSRVK